MPGPIPNRSSDLSRKRDANRGHRIGLTKGVAKPVSWPEPDPEWHVIATSLYEGAKASGQADFYQQSDIALLFSVCDDLSVYKKAGRTNDKGEFTPRRSPEMLKAILSAFTSLLITEGDRRRVRVELEVDEPEAESASVTAINSYKSKLGVS